MLFALRLDYDARGAVKDVRFDGSSSFRVRYREIDAR
jgi:hypothetical protein